MVAERRRSLRNSVTEGLASASFWRIARADSYAFRASAGLPVSLSRRPMLLWLSARLRWNSVTVGLASASFCRIARADSYDFIASSGLPVPSNSRPMLSDYVRQGELRTG